MVNGVQGLCIAHHVAKGNQGVQFVGRRLFVAAVHPELIYNPVEGLIIDLSAIALEAHQRGHIFCFRNRLPVVFKLRDQVIHDFSPVVVVPHILQHIESGGADELPGDMQSPFFTQKSPGLFDLDFACLEVFPGLEGACIMFVIIKEMYRDVFSAQEVEQGAVGIDAAENIQGLDAFYREVARFAFAPGFVHCRKLQGIVPAAHPARIEEIVAFFHLCFPVNFSILLFVLVLSIIFEKTLNQRFNMITKLDQLDLSKHYTYADYLNWRFEDVVELIRGKIFKMSPAPGSNHQDVSRNLLLQIGAYLKGKGCKVYHAPFDVRLHLPSQEQDDETVDTVVQPDLCVICDLRKIDPRGCNGAPDWIIEILSKGTASKDLIEKFQIYQNAGVREYWIVHPGEGTVLPYLLNTSGEYELSRQRPYSLTENVPVGIFPDLDIDLSQIFE
jgi:Uma2 family endonuclease